MGKVSCHGFRNLLRVATCILSTSLTMQAVAADSSAAVKLLLARARTLAAHGHLDIAVQTWQQVLLSEANNLEALRGIADADMQLGKKAEAQIYLERLKRAGGSQTDVNRIENLQGMAPQQERLAKAGALARAGQYAQAMQIYREVFGNDPPAGDWALAYYDTEAASEAGRAHAVAGLRKLVAQFPAEERYSITLGRILTYSPATRTEGIAILRRYQDVASADDALKQALAWEAQANRSANRDGEGGRNGLTSHESSPGDNPAYGAAYHALNSGELSVAEEKFQSLLSHDPQDGRALAGMGYLRMKQQAFADAAHYFDQAIAAGNHDHAVSESLATSRFWDHIQKAGDLLKNGDAEPAIIEYQQALSIRSNSPEALEGLGGAYLKAGAPEKAIDFFKREIAIDSSLPNAWRGLLLAQSQSGRLQEAISSAERIPPGVRQQLERDADFLSTLASDYSAAGDQTTADRIVKRALSMPLPDAAEDLPVSKQMQYASLLMMARRYNAASRMYEAVVAADPENVDAWRALVSVHHQLGHDAEALHDVQRMPEQTLASSRKDSSFLVLLASVYQSQHQYEEAQQCLEAALAQTRNPPVNLQTQLASVYMASGQGERAYAVYQHALQTNPDSLEAWRGVLGALHQLGRDREALEQVSSIPDDLRRRLDQDPGYLETVAGIRSSLGQTRQAFESYSRIDAIYAAQGSAPPADTLLGEGWLLLNAGEDGRLYQTISRLSTENRLTSAQKKQLDQLWTAWSIRRAHTLAKAGEVKQALAILQAAAQAFPGDAGVDGALADIYLESGAAKQALSLYTTLDMSQATADQYQAAVGAALAAHDRRQAEQWLQAALDHYSRDPKILQLAAQFEQDRGDAHKAAVYYAAALRAMGPQTKAELLANNSSGETGVGRPGVAVDPRENLLQMLAPPGRRADDGAALDSAGSGFAVLGSGPSAPRTLADVPDDPVSLDADPPGRNQEAATPFSAHRRSQETQTDMWPAQAGTADELSAPYGRKTNADGTGQAVRRLDPAKSPATAGGKGAEPTRIRPAALILPTAPLHLFGQMRSSQQPASENSGWSAPERMQTSDIAFGSASSSNDEMASETPLPPLTGSSSRSMAMIRPQTQREQIEEKLASIESASSGWLGGTSSVDYHSGQPGYDQLTIFSSETEESSMLGVGARATVVVNPVLLDNGNPAASPTYTQGTLAAGVAPGVQTAAGVGGEFQIRTRSVGFGLGYTPHGFLVENVTGRLLVQPNAGPVAFSFERQPVFDSQLSYAGLRDVGSEGPSYPGNIWGGVISNAAEVRVSRGDGNAGWYLQGGGQYITGAHVETNQRIDGDAGSYWAVWSQPDSGVLTLGANFFGMHYAHNLRYFTYGQGGYFSPGAYLLANVPVTFAGHYGNNFHYLASGSLGVQAFQEDSAPYYPLDPALEAAALNAYYQDRTSVGGNYDLKAEAAYAISDHWYVGALLSLNNSRDYNNSQVGFFVRYMFHKQTPDGQFGPTGMIPVDGFRPLQLP